MPATTTISQLLRLSVTLDDGQSLTCYASAEDEPRAMELFALAGACHTGRPISSEQLSAENPTVEGALPLMRYTVTLPDGSAVNVAFPNLSEHELTFGQLLDAADVDADGAATAIHPA